MRARLGRVLLVVALLLAQQTALAHQIWHVSAAGHAGVAQAGDQEGNGPQKDRLCDWHTALGSVLGALSGHAAAAELVDPAYIGFITADAPALAVAAPSPASRGPPLFL